jgi:hypothetical protein
MVNEYSKLFNDNMSSFEARNVFWDAAEKLPKSEREKLFAAYEDVSRIIFERERRENEGYCTADRLS